MALNLPYNVRILNPASDIDSRYGVYNSIADALEGTRNVRDKGLTVGILDENGSTVEYWFKSGIEDEDLVLKQIEVTEVEQLTAENGTNIQNNAIRLGGKVDEPTDIEFDIFNFYEYLDVYNPFTDKTTAQISKVDSVTEKDEVRNKLWVAETWVGSGSPSRRQVVLLRYNLDTLAFDLSFDPVFLGTFSYHRINTIFVLSDGSVLVGGSLNIPTVGERGIVRIGFDRTIDSSMSTMLAPTTSQSVKRIWRDTYSSKLYMARGSSSKYNQNSLIRVNSDLTLDTGFAVNGNLAFGGSNNAIRVLIPLPDGEFYMMGSFSTLFGSFDNGKRAYITNNGTTYSSVLPNFLGNSNQYIDHPLIALERYGDKLYGITSANGIWIDDDFLEYPKRVIRLNLDYSIDPTFDLLSPITIDGSTEDVFVSFNTDDPKIVFDNNGNIYTNTFFRKFETDVTRFSRIVKLNPNGLHIDDARFAITNNPNSDNSGIVTDMFFHNNLLYVSGLYRFVGDQLLIGRSIFDLNGQIHQPLVKTDALVIGKDVVSYRFESHDYYRMRTLPDVEWVLKQLPTSYNGVTKSGPAFFLGGYVLNETNDFRFPLSTFPSSYVNTFVGTAGRLSFRYFLEMPNDRLLLVFNRSVVMVNKDGSIHTHNGKPFIYTSNNSFFNAMYDEVASSLYIWNTNYNSVFSDVSTDWVDTEIPVRRGMLKVDLNGVLDTNFNFSTTATLYGGQADIYTAVITNAGNIFINCSFSTYQGESAQGFYWYALNKNTGARVYGNTLASAGEGGLGYSSGIDGFGASGVTVGNRDMIINSEGKVFAIKDIGENWGNTGFRGLVPLNVDVPVGDNLNFRIDTTFPQLFSRAPGYTDNQAISNGLTRGFVLSGEGQQDDMIIVRSTLPIVLMNGEIMPPIVRLSKTGVVDSNFGKTSGDEVGIYDMDSISITSVNRSKSNLFQLRGQFVYHTTVGRIERNIIFINQHGRIDRTYEGFSINNNDLLPKLTRRSNPTLLNQVTFSTVFLNPYTDSIVLGSSGVDQNFHIYHSAELNIPLDFYQSVSFYKVLSRQNRTTGHYTLGYEVDEAFKFNDQSFITYRHFKKLLDEAIFGDGPIGISHAPSTGDIYGSQNGNWVIIPPSDGGTDLTGYATEQWVQQQIDMLSIGGDPRDAGVGMSLNGNSIDLGNENDIPSGITRIRTGLSARVGENFKYSRFEINRNATGGLDPNLDSYANMTLESSQGDDFKYALGFISTYEQRPNYNDPSIITKYYRGGFSSEFSFGTSVTTLNAVTELGKYELLFGAGALGDTWSGAKFTDTINNRGLEYAEDYEPNFTARSLVTKQYVDAAIVAIGGGGTPLNPRDAGVGLSLEGNDISLGTNIGGGSRLVNIYDWVSSEGLTELVLGTYYDSLYFTLSEDSEGAYAELYTPNSTNSHRSGFTYLSNTNRSYVDIFSTVSNGSQSYRFQLDINIITPSNNKATFQDSVNNKGLEYAGDYELNFTSKSLITKQYVDQAIAGLGSGGSVNPRDAGKGLSLDGNALQLGEKVFYNHFVDLAQFGETLMSGFNSYGIEFGDAFTPMMGHLGIYGDRNAGNTLGYGGIFLLNTNPSGSQSGFMTTQNFESTPSDGNYTEMINSRNFAEWMSIILNDGGTQVYPRGMIVVDNIHSRGLSDLDDYSANKTAYSYVTVKMLNDAVLSAGGGISHAPSNGQFYASRNGAWEVFVIPSLAGYATESFVTSQGYITSADLSNYATESFVTSQGYLVSSDITGLATESYVDTAVGIVQGNLDTYIENADDQFPDYSLQFTENINF
jgi:hypothetical protein